MSESEEDLYLNWLIDHGAVEVVSVREDGEFLYSLTTQCKEVAPEFYEEWVSGTNEIVRSLWEKDMLSLVWTDDDILVSLTDKSFDPDEVSKLDTYEHEILMEVIHDFADALATLERSEESEEPV